MLKLIVAMDQKGCIGKDNKLPWHCPSDLKHFYETIQDAPLLMGKNTFDSYKTRKNEIYVVTHREIDTNEQIHICSELNIFLNEWNKDLDLFICGGASIYEQAFPFVDECIISVIDGIYDGDTFFPKLDFSQFKECISTKKDGFQLYHLKK